MSDANPDVPIPSTDVRPQNGRGPDAGAPVYVSVSRLQVDPSRVDDLVSAFRSRLGQVDAFPGFLGLEVWHSDRSPGEILMVSHWHSKAEFTAYMRSEAHHRSHERIPIDLEQAIHLERLDHVTGYDVVAR